MKFYIAARLQEFARPLKTQLHELGHVVTSRWIYEPNFGYNKKPGEYRQRAIEDMQDVKRCDELIMITEPNGEPSRGGRHVEKGIAMALNKRINLIGGFENVFDEHPLVKIFPTTEAFIQDLIKRDQRHKGR